MSLTDSGIEIICCLISFSALPRLKQAEGDGVLAPPAAYVGQDPESCRITSGASLPPPLGPDLSQENDLALQDETCSDNHTEAAGEANCWAQCSRCVGQKGSSLEAYLTPDDEMRGSADRPNLQNSCIFECTQLQL